MKLTLITVCFNSAHVIRTALESVLSQKGIELDYVVVDGGSTDGTVEIIKEYELKFAALSSSSVSFRWLSEKDEGMYDAINKGIRLAVGEFVGILHADDCLDGVDVLHRVSVAIETAKTDAVFGNVRFVKDVGGRTQRVCFARYWRPWMLQWGYMPPHPAIYIRRTCFEKWGTYEPSRAEYRIAADCELLIRFFCKNRMSYRYVPINTTVMRLGGLSTKNLEARKKLNEEIIKGNRVNGYFCCWPMLLPKYLVKIWEVILPRMGVMA